MLSFDELLNAVHTLLQAEQRVAYRTLKRKFDLNDDDIEDLKAELIDAKRVAVDENDKVLVLAGAAEDGVTAATSLPATADRRLITVMFCDIVGSTELSARFDAEELRDVIREYQQICARIISELEGHVAQYLGDGLLVYFGYPTALEDEAGRCVQAGLEILSALKKADTLSRRLGAPLQVRIGIHTGHVVIGEMGAANRHERLALGETPNIAARVQGAARPNEILITDATHRLVQGIYDCELHGPHSLKGVAEPVKLFTVRGDAQSLNRFEVALSTGNLTSFVGREQELGMLNQQWQQAERGRGQVVMLSGEAGMGKSRLAQQFKNGLSENTRQITLRCSPNHTGSAYYPVIHWIRRVCAIEPADDARTAVDKLDQTLEPYTFPEAATAPLLAGLLDLPHDQNELLQSVDPDTRKLQVHQAVVDWLLEEAASRPVYMIWDDVHWMDSATHELLRLYLEHIHGTTTLALLVFRSDFSPPWSARDYFQRLSLSRLPDSDADRMISDIANLEPAPAALTQHIREKADGIPLYIEELTKSVIEAGGIDANWEAVQIPATLQDSLEARLDRCPRGKQIAQWGAAIGREFSHAILEHLVDDRVLLSNGLDELLEAELVYRSGTRSNLTYIFKHALIRDTAYESLLIRQRREFHAAIGHALETGFEGIVRSQPELVAQHFAEGGEPARAVDHLCVAATRAIKGSAAIIALEHLHEAARIAATLPESADRARLELRIHLLMGPLVSAERGNGSDEVEAIYNNAIALSDAANDGQSKFPAYFGLRACYLARADLKSAHEIGQLLHRSAVANGQAEYLLEANIALAGSSFFRGEYSAMQTYTDDAWAVYNPAEHARHAYIYGLEPGSLCLTRKSFASWLLGQPDDALKHMRDALQHVESVSHQLTRAFVYGNCATLCYWLGESERQEALSNDALILAEEFGVGFIRGWSLIQRGNARVMQGNVPDGLKDIDSGLTVFDNMTAAGDIRSQLMYSAYVALIAEAYGQCGDAERGMALIPEAVSHIERTGARYSEPMLYRVRGELLAMLGLHTEARRSFEHSLKIATEKQSPTLTLQASIGLAGQYRNDGSGDPEQLLISAIAPFAERDEFRDIVRARALLAA